MIVEDGASIWDFQPRGGMNVNSQAVVQRTVRVTSPLSGISSVRVAIENGLAQTEETDAIATISEVGFRWIKFMLVDSNSLSPA